MAASHSLPDLALLVAKGQQPEKGGGGNGLQKSRAPCAHYEKAGAEGRFCETSQAFKALKEVLVTARVL